MKYFAFFSILLGLLVLRYVSFVKSQPVYKDGDKVNFEHTLLDEPKILGSKQFFYINEIRVIADKSPQLHYADKIKVSGVIEKSIISRGNNGVISKSEILIVKNPKIEAVENERNFMLSITSFIRQRVTDTFNSTLGRNQSGLLLGIVLGLKSEVDSRFYQALRNAGVLHVVAASGMNVSMVGGFLFGFFLLFVKRRLALFFTLFGIAFYALLSGLDPSIIRASVMAGFAYSASILGRQNYAYSSLFLAGFIMLFISPSLLQDLGFALSFTSTLGILSVKPVLAKFPLLPQNNFLSLKDDFLTTISAQLGSLPVLLGSFGSYQLLSIVINILVLWTVPVLMLLGGIAAIFSLFAPPIASIFLYFSLPFLLFFESIVMLFAGLSKPAQFGSFPALAGLGYYLMLIAVVIYLNKIKAKHESQNSSKFKIQN